MKKHIVTRNAAFAKAQLRNVYRIENVSIDQAVHIASFHDANHRPVCFIINEPITGLDQVTRLLDFMFISE